MKNDTKLVHKAILLITIGLLAFSISCQESKSFKVQSTYLEAEDPTPEMIDWNHLAKGLHSSVVSTNIRFVKNEIPKVKASTSWEIKAWKGERVSAQFVFWSLDSLTNITAKGSDLVSDTGEKIEEKNLRLRFVKYVITDEFGGGCGYRKPEDFVSSLAADALDHSSSYAIKSKETRPLWLTLDIPETAIEGNYKSTVTIDVEGQESIVFELNVEVLPKTLPAPGYWKFHLDLWQNPYAVARFHEVEPWSDAHMALLKPVMKELAEAGQKVITVSLNKRPWGGQTYDEFEAMIEWRKNTDGTWTYDYTIFDKWVKFMMDLGIKNQISCYSMVPWGNEFYYFDEEAGEQIKIKAIPGSKEYVEFWVPFLKSFKSHLVEKGWNKITRMAMDERKPKEMKALFNLLQEHAPEFGASLADNHKSYKLYPDQLMDLSVAFGAIIDSVDLKQRKDAGFISTHYVCCADPFPNVFTFSPPAEGVFIGWYSVAAGFDGFLRWAYNSWVENPLEDSRFRTWPAGDTYIVYPDARSSIRFETLREGIEDAEKIRILRADFKKRGLLEELHFLNEVVAEFNRTTAPENLEKMIENGQAVLNILAKK